MPLSLRRLVFPATVVLVGINLRPLLAAIGPLLDQIQRDTGLSDTGASLLTSLPVMLMGVCLLGTAPMRAALGSRLGVAVGLGAVAIGSVARWYWPSATALLVTAILGGIGIAAVQALMPGIIRQRASDGAARMMGFYSTAIMGGATIASFSAPWIAQAGGWPLALGIWAALAVIGCVVWWSATDTTDEVAAPQAAIAPWRSGRGWLLLTFFGVGTGAYTLVLAWLPPYYTGLGWSAEAAGALLAALTLAEVAAGIAISSYVERFRDRRPMILAAIGALLAGLLCLTLAPLPLALPAAALAGLGIGALFPLSLIVAMDHGRDAGEAGLIVGFVQGGGYVLAALLPLVAGTLRQLLADLTLAWWLMAALCVLLGVIALRLRPDDRLGQV